MLEYASVTASAYDVDSLVGKLNAHASQGWEVTSVVAAGGDVVAIMQRVRSAVDSAPAEAAAEEAPVMAAVPAEEGAPVVEAPIIEEAQAFSEAASSVAEVTAPAVEASPIIESVAEATPSSVEEAASSFADHGAGLAGAGAAAGVGIGSIFGNDTPAADVDSPAVEAVTPPVEAVTPVIETVAPVAVEVPAAVEPSGWGSAQTTVGTPVVPTPAPAPAPVVTTPAGWYPDPSGRFEMRYWDGSAWTEHVSRQGQQFTDPPVA
jgi:Protein of unknown function (DUF2510)